MAAGGSSQEVSLRDLRRRIVGNRQRREMAERRVLLLRRRILIVRGAAAEGARKRTSLPPPGDLAKNKSLPTPPDSSPVVVLPDDLTPLSERSFTLRKVKAAVVPGLSLTEGATPPEHTLRSTKYFGSPLQVLNKLTTDTVLGTAAGGRLSEGDKAHKAQRLQAQLARTVRVTNKEVLDSVVSIEDTLGRDAVKTLVHPIIASRVCSFEDQAAVKDIHSRLLRLSEVGGFCLQSMGTQSVRCRR